MDNLAHTLWSVLLLGWNPWVILGANLPDLFVFFNDIDKLVVKKGYQNITNIVANERKWFEFMNTDSKWLGFSEVIVSIPFLILLSIPAFFLKNNNYNNFLLAYSFHVFADIFTHPHKVRLFYPFSKRGIKLFYIPQNLERPSFLIINYLVLGILFLIKLELI